MRRVTPLTRPPRGAGSSEAGAFVRLDRPRPAASFASSDGGRMGPEGLLVSVSGIRGRVGAGLTPEVVTGYAAAFGAWAMGPDSGKAVVVGRDSRVSGPMFHRSA